MAVDPSVRIDIAAEFTGKKAFKQADTSTAQLSKNVKNLAKTFGVAFSVTKVLAYAKASVKAAAADQKAQQQLALALKNVGLGRDAATAEGYIQRIEKEFGIVDDKLRPAYTKLAIATRDTAETERLMGIAMDISANSGKDLESVTAALSKAYLGNNATLSKLGIGISKADLKTKSFKEITDQLAVTFAGAAKTSADSFAGSMDKLAIASNNAKEIIGTSLINALQSLGEDDSISTLGADIEGAATSLANFVDSIVYLKEQVKSIPGAGIFGYLFSGVTDLLGRFSPQRLAELIKEIKGFQGMGNVAMTGGSNMDTQKFEADQKKLAANKLAADKKAAANKIKADKMAAANKAKLDKAAAVFEIQKIQIAAALKGKISEEEKVRLLLMQAIEEGNADKAETLAKKLEDIQKQNAKIAADLLAISQAKDPFSTWAGSLLSAYNELNRLKGGMLMIPGVTFNPGQSKDRNYDLGQGSGGGGTGGGGTGGGGTGGGGTGGGGTGGAGGAGGGGTGGGGDPVIESIFAEDDTIEAILEKVENIAAEAAAAAEAVAASVAETQVTVDALAEAATNGYGMAGTNFNPGQSADRNYDSGYSNAPTIIINNNGSVIMQDELVDVINDALLAGQRIGLSSTVTGAVPR
jgi:hypothetical protein